MDQGGKDLEQLVFAGQVKRRFQQQLLQLHKFGLMGGGVEAAVGETAHRLAAQVEKTVAAAEIGDDVEMRQGAVADADDVLAVGNQFSFGILHGLQDFPHMFEIVQHGPPVCREFDHEVHVLDGVRFDKDQFALGPCPFFPGFGDAQHGVQDRVDADERIPAEQHIHFIHNEVAHRMGGIAAQHIAGCPGVKIAVRAQVMGQQPGGMFEPAFGRPDGAHVRMVPGEPHLVKDDVGTGAVRDKAGQIEILHRMKLLEAFYPGWLGRPVPPGLRPEIKLLQSGFMAAQQMLRIDNMDGIARVQGIKQRHPAGT